MSVNDILVAEFQAQAARLQYERAQAQHTEFTWVQRSRGAGCAQIHVPFDVLFTVEPTFNCGSSLQSIDRPGFFPIASALVLAWTRDQASGLYTAATVLLNIDVRAGLGVALNRAPAPGGSGTAIPVVAHHLTFSGPAMGKTAGTGPNPRSSGAGV